MSKLAFVNYVLGQRSMLAQASRVESPQQRVKRLAQRKRQRQNRRRARRWQ